MSVMHNLSIPLIMIMFIVSIPLLVKTISHILSFQSHFQISQRKTTPQYHIHNERWVARYTIMGITIVPNIHNVRCRNVD